MPRELAARVGDYESQVPVEEGLRRVLPEARDVSTEPGLNRLAEAADTVAKSDASVKAMGILADTQRTWQQQLEQMKQAAQPGAPGFTGQVMQQYGQYVDKAMKQAPSLSANFLQERLTDFGNQLSQHALGWEADQRQAHYVNTTNQASDAAALGLQQDPSGYNDQAAALQHSIGQLNMDPGEREKLALETQHKLALSATMAHINGNPTGAMTELLNPNTKFDYMRDLSEQERQASFQHADSVLHQRVEDANLLDRMQHDSQERAGEQVANQAISLSAKGQLTATWVESHAATLNPAMHERLLDIARGKDVTSDWNSVRTIMTDLTDGKDVRAEANAAFAGGRLAKDDYVRFMGASEKLPPYYKQGQEFITGFNKQSLLEFSPARAQDEAQEQNDWMDWAMAHPQATHDESEQTFRQIVKNYSYARGENTLSTLALPMHLVGTRTKPDYDATEAAIMNAWTKGEISTTERIQEAGRLQHLRDLETEQARAQAAKAAQGAK